MACKVISIEGIDGSGKTYLCENVKKFTDKSRIAVVKTPTAAFKDFCNYSVLQGKAASFSAFMLSNLALEKAYDKYDWLILDRYILSTIVYHYDFLKESGIEYVKLLKALPLLLPSYTIYLEADQAVIEGRVKVRNDQSNHSYSAVQLMEKFNTILSDSHLDQWKGELVRLRSDSYEDAEVNTLFLQELINT